MRKTKILLTAVLAAAFAAGPGVGEAKRIGAKSTKNSSTPTKKVDDEETKASGSMPLSLRPRLPVAAGTAAGVVAGGAAAATAELAQQQASPEEQQAEAAALAERKPQEKLTAFGNKALIEDAVGKAEQAAAAQKALTARLENERLMREQEAEAKRRAEEDRQAMRRAQALERDRACIIQPVMSDAEIERCKWAWSVPPPG